MKTVSNFCFQFYYYKSGGSKPVAAKAHLAVSASVTAPPRSIHASSSKTHHTRRSGEPAAPPHRSPHSRKYRTLCKRQRWG